MRGDLIAVCNCLRRGSTERSTNVTRYLFTLFFKGDSEKVTENRDLMALRKMGDDLRALSVLFFQWERWGSHRSQISCLHDYR